VIENYFILSFFIYINKKKDIKNEPIISIAATMSSTSMSSTMSVTQALAEIKLVRNRLESALEHTNLIVLKKKRDLIDPAAFSLNAMASYQSVLDLLERYNLLKSRVVQSNATTLVTIAGKTYSVADAVERKRSIDYEKTLLLKMKQQLERVRKEFTDHSAMEQARVERLVMTELGKESKTNVEVVSQLTETFLAQNRAEIVDPLGLAEQIKKLEKHIEDFETQVDWVLSESNGKTLITL
jgi:hypothetical protein